GGTKKMTKKIEKITLIKTEKATKKDINQVFNKFENVKCDRMINEENKENSYILLEWNGNDMKNKKAKIPEQNNWNGLIQAIIPVFKNMLDESNEKLKTEILDEINPRLNAIENDIKILKSDVVELKSNVKMLKSFHVEDIKKYDKKNYN
ncbi:hypothetical protein, partial [Mycoplasma elephantis]|uniref:hypothetical protein n=1 Tax=Mycoplasma elephantis TaxID=114882 RepID=UPI000567E4D6